MADTITGRDRVAFLIRCWVPVAAYGLMIFTLSAQPNLKPPLHFQNSDKLMHFSEYGVFGLLLAHAMRASLPSRDVVWGALLALAVGMAIGAGDERFQSLIPGRECSILDWFADSTGLTFAQLAYLALARESKA